MYQPTNSAIGIVQAIVNVPHELPGTSRSAFCGQDEAGPPRGRPRVDALAGNGEPERLVERHRLVRRLAER